MEDFFSKWEIKIELYERNVTSTNALYVKDNAEFIKNITEEYDRDIVRAYNDYTRFYGESDGVNDSERRQDALTKSGEQDIQGYYDYQVAQAKGQLEEMLDYFARSSIVIVHSLLETELRKLCHLLQYEVQSKLALEDLEAKNYIKASLKYLELVIGMNLEDIYAIADKMEEIQYVRNRIVHNGGEFGFEKNDVLDQTVRSLSAYLTLEVVEDGKLRVIKFPNTEIVSYAYSLMRRFFIELLWKLEEKLRYPILCDRLKVLFDFPKDSSIITGSKVKTTKGSRTVSVDIKKRNGLKFNCNITIVKSVKREVELINQLEPADAIKEIRPDFHLLSRTEEIFDLFGYATTKSKFTIMCF